MMKPGGGDTPGLAQKRLNAIFQGETVHWEAHVSFRPLNLPGTPAPLDDFAFIDVTLDNLYKSMSKPSKQQIVTALKTALDKRYSTPEKRRAFLNKPKNTEYLMRGINKRAGIFIKIHNTDFFPLETLIPHLGSADDMLVNSRTRQAEPAVFRQTPRGPRPYALDDLGPRRQNANDVWITTHRKWADAYQKIIAMKFTIRHYTRYAQNQTHHPFIKSSAELEIVDNIRGKSTTSKDWNTLGNTAYTFYLLCINGIVPNRGFLKDSTHYAEFSLDQIPSVFISGDLLDIKKIAGARAFSGSGSNVKRQLVRLISERFAQASTVINPTPAICLDVLESLIPRIEVKVPGGLRPVAWQRK